MSKSRSYLSWFKIVFLFTLFINMPSAFATPIDLTDFIASDPLFVTESNGRIEFTEQGGIGASSEWIYGNANYMIAPDATTMTFDYGITLGEDDMDYFTFEINYDEVFTTSLWSGPNTETGTATIDLTPYQGATVQIDWGLYWGADDAANATAFVENIDIAAAQTDPVPEPSTIVLFSLGLFCLAGAGRKKTV